MRQAVLLGSRGGRRAAYLQKAAEEQKIPLQILDWRDWGGEIPEGELFLKIDPPLWESSSLTDLDRLTREYLRELSLLAGKAEERPVEFFNTPEVIAALLDKRQCKERLLGEGLPVTALLESEKGPVHMRDLDGLLEAMRRSGVFQVFIKPVRGSGAAGVSAFRLQPGTGRMSLYTCARYLPGEGIVNTKELRNYREPGEIRRLLDGILELPCVVERWYAKASRGGYSYDLRAVVQEGRVDYVLARLSKGPITNLQLNNHPLPVEALGLPEQVQEEIAELCKRALACFPGLVSAGIDLLLEKGSLSPRIIEMNAQGDLIYQDIFQENRIYRRQAERMSRWLYGSDFPGDRRMRENE